MDSSPVQVHTYEDIAVGQRAVLELSVTPELIDAFSRLTGDVNPLHSDAAFAAAKGYPARVAHGLLVGSCFSAIAGTMLPGRDCLLQSAKFDFKKPVLAGTRLTLEAVVSQKSDAVRAVVLDLTARDAAGAVALTGRLQAGVLE